MILDLPPADLNNLVIEKLRSNFSNALCYYTPPPKPPDGWGVLSSGSGTNTTLSIQLGAQLGDVPLVLDGSYSAEMAQGLRIVTNVFQRLAPPK